MEHPFYKDGLSFSCQRCSHCCRGEPGYVYLSRRDLTNLLECFKFDKDDFIREYCRFVPYYDGSEVLCLKEKPGYDCILWENGGCLAYKARPVQCSTYPFWSFLLASRNSWDRECSDCPGINRGEHHSFEEIQAAKQQYEENYPLRRGEV